MHIATKTWEHLPQPVATPHSCHHLNLWRGNPRLHRKGNPFQLLYSASFISSLYSQQGAQQMQSKCPFHETLINVMMLHKLSWYLCKNSSVANIWPENLEGGDSYLLKDKVICIVESPHQLFLCKGNCWKMNCQFHLLLQWAIREALICC